MRGTHGTTTGLGISDPRVCDVRFTGSYVFSDLVCDSKHGRNRLQTFGARER